MNGETPTFSEALRQYFTTSVYKLGLPTLVRTFYTVAPLQVLKRSDRQIQTAGAWRATYGLLRRQGTADVASGV